MDSYQFIPAVQVLRIAKEKPFFKLNESDLYDMHYYTTEKDDNGDLVSTKVNSITCDVYIDKYL